MPKTIKIFIGVAVASVVIFGIAVALLMSNLDGIVKTAIETFGSQVAGVPVRVSAVNISLSEGRGTIKGLTVANPAGFKTPTAFSLGEITLAIDTGSVTKDPVVIKEITVAAPEVTYEVGAGGSNVDAIKKNVAAATGGGKPAKEPAKESGDTKKLIIDLLQMKAGKVNLAMQTPIPTGAMSSPLPDIKLTGIGRKSNGASGAEVAAQIMDALTKASLEAGSKMMGNVKDMAQKAVEGGAQKAMEKVGAPAGAADAVKGLLGR